MTSTCASLSSLAPAPLPVVAVAAVVVTALPVVTVLPAVLLAAVLPVALVPPVVPLLVLLAAVVVVPVAPPVLPSTRRTSPAWAATKSFQRPQRPGRDCLPWTSSLLSLLSVVPVL